MPTFPPRPIRWATYRLSILVWLVLRAFLAAQNGSLAVLFPVSLLVMLAVGAVAATEMSVSRERVFLENLGIGRRSVFALSFLFAGALETMAALVHFVTRGPG